LSVTGGCGNPSKTQKMLLPKPSNQRRPETWPLVAGVFVLCAFVALSVKALKVGNDWNLFLQFWLWMLKGNWAFFFITGLYSADRPLSALCFYHFRRSLKHLNFWGT
jgi:hypothetical protein